MTLFSGRLNALLAMALAALLALGAVSAFAGPASDDPGDVVTVDNGDGDTEGDTEGGDSGEVVCGVDGDTEGNSEGDTDGDTDGDTEGDADCDADGDAEGDADGDAEGDADGEANGGEGEDTHRVAQAIADTFGVTVDEVLALHDSGLGFGAIFKLYLLAAAGDTTVEALQSAAEGDGGFAFGKLFKEEADGVSALSAGEDGIPKNLGQAVSDGENDDEGADVAADGDGDDDGSHGPPDHASAHGRR